MNKEIMYAHNVLKAVYFDDAYSSIELNKILKNSALENLNKQLITKIVYGVLEKDIYLSYVVGLFCNKKPDVKTELLLKVGIYILKFVNSIPPFACVNEIVELCKKQNSKFVSGFLNATLKKISVSEIKLPSEKNKVEYLSIKYSYPKWFVEKLLQEHDLDFVVNLLEYSLTTLTHVRILTEKISVEDFFKNLAENQIEFEKSPINFGVYLNYSKLLKNSFLSDCCVPQGVPSIVVGENVPKNSKIDVLDLCSAPGGKSILVAQNNPNGRIISCDISEKRLKLVKEYADKLKIKNIAYKVNDATILNEKWIEKFDVVLCDVPCSNLGICNKKPDVLLRKTPNNIKQLVPIQRKIIKTAANYVKNGGLLIYSTCTILNDENNGIIQEFLSNNKNFEAIELNTFNINVIKENEAVTFIPHLSDTEGFFIGGLRKK